MTTQHTLRPSDKMTIVIFAKVLNKETGQLVDPAYGVGVGGRGTWINTHFATLPEAEAFYDRQVAYVLTGWTDLPHRITEGHPNDRLKVWEIVNVKKNGQVGKYRNTVHLYQIEQVAK